MRDDILRDVRRFCERNTEPWAFLWGVSKRDWRRRKNCKRNGGELVCGRTVSEGKIAFITSSFVRRLLSKSDIMLEL